MAIEFITDGTYFNWRAIDGYNKTFNFAFGPREPGKTADTWYEKIWKPWKKDHKPWIYLVRQSVEITEALIESIFNVNIRKFSDDEFDVIYKLGSLKDGIVDVYVSFYHHETQTRTDDDGSEIDEEVKIVDSKDLIFRIVSLSISIRRLKLAVLRDIKGVYCDEYIINPKSGEKYQPQEAFKIKEAYTTWRRENPNLKFYFTANPYSLFNPLFVDWGVDTRKLRKGEFYIGDTFAIQWVVLSDKLREKLLRENPLYQFDEEYSDYALEGTAVNDSNIRLGQLPQNYRLQFIFRVSGKYIGIFINNYIEDLEDRFFCKFLDEVGARRFSYCLDFEDMMDKSILLSLDDRARLRRFKESMRRNLVSFEDVNVYYFIVEIYKNL